MSALSALALAIGGVGCGDDADDEQPTFDEQACADFTVLQRFGFAWENNNHRISLYELRMDPETPCAVSTVEAGFIGGDFTTGGAFDAIDVPIAHLSWQSVASETTAQVGAARVSIPVVVGPEAVASGTIQYAREALSLRGYGRVDALISGLRFSTDVEGEPGYPDDYDPTHGYTSRGFGIEVEVASIDDEMVELAYSVRYENGTSFDRENLNRAIAYANVAAVVDVLLVGSTDVPIFDGGVSYSDEHQINRLAMDTEVPPAPAEDRRLVLDGTPAGPGGFYGLRSFDVVLDPYTECGVNGDCSSGESCGDDGQCTSELGLPGYFVREITVGVERESYNEDTGVASFLVTGYANVATKAIAFRDLRYHVDAEMVWFQVAGASEPQSFDTCFETGTTAFSLTNPPGPCE